METVWVTGAGGFLGSHLAERFLKEGARVVGLDNFCTGMPANLEPLKAYGDRFHFVEADVSRPWSEWLNTVPEDFRRDVRFVLHFASPASPPLYQKMAVETLHVNSVGLENACEFAAKHGGRAIFASTSEVYGDPSVSPQPESYWGNVNSFGERSCYDEAKRYGEALIFSLNRLRGTSHGLVRIFNTYGPRMNPADGRVIINFLVQAKEGRDLTVYGDGKQTRSFCYVDDLVDGIVSYARSGLTEPVNLGNPVEFTMLELAEVVREISGKKELKITFHPMPADDPKRRRPDIAKAQEKLKPWAPRVPLREGLVKMKAWLDSRGV